MSCRIAGFSVLLAFALTAVCGAAAVSWTPSTATRAQLAASAVPVFLPTFIPSAAGPVRSVTVMTADANGYMVAFSPVPHCAGALSCAFFHITGSPATARPHHSDRRARTVRFADGTRAVYVPRDCSGASCTEASLTFERRGAIYELDLKTPGSELGALQCAYRHLRRIRSGGR